jgi:hypothetical protein
MRRRNELPPEYKDLITKVRNHHPDTGGENRGAVAEIQVRSMYATEQATNGLRYATWALVLATLILSVITLLK